jgi:ribosomal protein S1
VLSVGQQVEVTVLEIDMERKRVSLGMKWEKVVVTETKKTPRPVKKAPVKKQREEETGGGMTSRISFG